MGNLYQVQVWFFGGGLLCYFSRGGGWLVMGWLTAFCSALHESSYFDSFCRVVVCQEFGEEGEGKPL